MVHMPGEVKGQIWKLAKPFYGPYRVVSLTPNNAEVVLVNTPKEPSIFFALSHIRRCYNEIPDSSWTGSNKKRKRQKKKTTLPLTKALSPQHGPVSYVF